MKATLTDESRVIIKKVLHLISFSMSFIKQSQKISK